MPSNRFIGREIALFIVTVLLAGCAKSSSTQLASRGVDAYCPYLPSKTFASPVTVSGSAVYEYRLNGNGVASDGGVLLTIDAFLNAATRSYSLTVNSRTYTITSSLGQTAAQQDVVTKLKAEINADAASGFFAYGIAQLTVTQPGVLASPTITGLSRMTITSTNPTARPIRFAEVAVKAASGEIVQCAETANDGSYSFQLPVGSGDYTIEVRSRAANSRSNVYVLNDPTNNLQHSISTTIASATSSTGGFIRAPVRGTLMGGAFNILDQLLNAQDYLRTETSNCDQSGDPNFFAGCVPFTSSPLVKVYWTPGLSPSIYVNSTGSISYYVNNRRELYLQGGQAGNVTSSDMDHFDDSVIIHEYAHFIEDVFGEPDSPGGSHNADSIVDPRLAWGEGWANFFQAAVTGNAVYRDTYGTPDCTSACAGTYFNESIDPVGTPPNDAPTQGALGEGNFREFSVTRMLWDVIKPVGGVSRFAEIWRAIVVTGSGMHDVDDPFKTVGRLHQIQTAFAGTGSWSALRLNEEQIPGFSVYATPFSIGGSCATSPVDMTQARSPGDNGSFATSDQYRNNDFYRFSHAGGNFTLELFYSKDGSNVADLDFYLYRSKYVFGRSSDILMSSAFVGDGCPASGSQSNVNNGFRAQNGCPSPPAGLSSTYGYEKSTVSLGAGTYMINVQADTTRGAGAATKYVLMLNGQVICPQL